MVETITAAVSPALEHIIERPRLIARLDEGGGSRVAVLAAPAGYGKTTLARQWSELQTGPVAWYRTTRASGDVALLAVQLDELLASAAPGLQREAPTVASIASVNPSPKPLGRAIIRTFEPLTRDVLLVVDEWEAAATDEADELLSMLVEGLDIRFLITTRARPEWFTPRLEMYSEGLEIGMHELAMTDEEAAQVLAALGAVGGRARLMRTAGGWPAVLGLAAMSGDIDFTASRLLSHRLYEYLAGELLAGAEPGTQDALMILAVTSISDLETASKVLGEQTNHAIEDAVAHGLLAITGRKSLSLHPLLRELLMQRFAEADAETRSAVLSRCRRLFASQQWDEALCVAEAAQDQSFVTEAVAAALDDLLAAGRTSSLQRWVTAARAAGAEGGLIDYAESEALLRGGELEPALALATQAAGSLDGDLAARAHLVAGRAAHLVDRPQRAQEHARSAAALSSTEETHEGALWLRFLAGLPLQVPDLRQRLDDFKRSARVGAKQSILTASGELTLAEIEGDLERAVADARTALSLANHTTDPIAHTSLLSTYSYALLMMCRYEESLKSLAKLRQVAETCDVEFPLQYVRLYSACACIGLRRFANADRVLASLERETQDKAGSYFRKNVPIQRARLYASVGDLGRAVDVLALGPVADENRGSHGEFLGWQGLLQAATGEFDVALQLGREARAMSRGLEASALGHLIQAVVALGTGDIEAADACIAGVIATGDWDPILIGVRALPDLGRHISKQRPLASWLQRLLLLSSDASLATSLGLRIPRAAKPKQNLTPRESEIHGLIAQGLTNEEIANLLYISLSTTKVHVKHILEKLGVRSRVEAARILSEDV